ncbi:hypothetical protein WMY93_003813 [Mugilogobius chulae]|uniref:Uncharacterized protein n=1 Tax=Mugilogobius chulae TaxID=88201 RepID=A0AAW0Q0Z2_9GOBI
MSHRQSPAVKGDFQFTMLKNKSSGVSEPLGVQGSTCTCSGPKLGNSTCLTHLERSQQRSCASQLPKQLE